MSTTEGDVAFVKGHGTGNDFILIPDLTGNLELSSATVIALCDRHRGMGADGVIRVTPTHAMAEFEIEQAEAQWFMDYRNADGSIAEMCGNGARVFAHYLHRNELVVGHDFSIGTRAGLRKVVVDGPGTVKVGMGAPVAGPAGPDPVVTIGANAVRGIAHWLPNPHAVFFVDDLNDAGPLVAAPDVTAGDRYPDGVNIEFVVDTSSADTLRASMRVYERGVGETLSCGTGACAVALSVLERHGVVGAGSVVVEVPGGALRIDREAAGDIWLSGPAVLVAAGHLSATWWKENS